MSQKRPSYMDGWENLINRLGDPTRDTRTQTTAGEPYYLTQTDAENLFHGNDLARRIVSLAPRQAFRRGFRLASVEEPEACGAVSQRMAELQLVQNLLLGAMWGRLFGGAVVYLGIDDGKDPSEPVDLDNIRDVLFSEVYNRYELEINKTYDDPLQPNFGKPEKLTPLTTTSSYGGQSMASKQLPTVHESRCLFFEGVPVSRLRRQRNTGWSDSVLQPVYETLRGYGVSWAAAEVLMHDFSQAKLTIKGLAEMIAAQGEDQVLTRMELMAYSRGILNVMLLDADNEQYTREATPLQGLPEILGLWLDRVSAAAEIPTSVLFGRTPGGMNATGKEDRALWYDTVADYQQQELGPQIEKLSKIMLSASEIGGGEPETWSVVWLPLWAPTDAERTVTRLQQAQIDQIYAAMDGGLSGEEIIQSRFGGDEYSYDTHVDGEARGLLEAVEGTTSGNPGEGVSVPRRLDAARAAAVQAVVEAVVAGRLPAPQGRALLTVAHGLQEAEAALLCPDELEEKAEEAAEAQAEAMAPEAAGEESGDVEETKEPQGGETERGSAPANPPKKANFTADPTKQPAPEGD